MPASRVISVDESSFDALVLQSEEPVLLDFTATWCGPCKAIAPVLDALSVEHEGRFKVVKVDLDASPNLATRYNVRGAPTLIAFENGVEVRRRTGAGTKSTLLALIDPPR